MSNPHIDAILALCDSVFGPDDQGEVPDLIDVPVMLEVIDGVGGVGFVTADELRRGYGIDDGMEQ